MRHLASLFLPLLMLSSTANAQPQNGLESISLGVLKETFAVLFLNNLSPGATPRSECVDRPTESIEKDPG